jgi:O-antigen/teichoic acid export membrane protein
MKVDKLKAGVVLSYIAIISNSVIGLIYTPYMLHKLGQSEYGLYSLTASIITYLTILDFGFGNAIVRFTSKFRALKKTQEQKEMLGMFFVLYTIIGILSFVIGLVLYFNIENMFSRTMTPMEVHRAKIMLLLLLFNLAFTFPMSVYKSLLLAYEEFVLQQVLNIIYIVFNPIVMVIMLFFGYKAIAMVVIQTIFNVATLLFDWWYCYHKLDVRLVFKRFRLDFFKEIIVYSSWVFLGAIMERIYWSTGQFILGIYKGTIAIAVFSVAIQLQRMFMSFSSAITNVFLPKVTSMVVTNKPKKEVSDLFIKTGRIQYIIMSYILIGFIVFGQDFINRWAGIKYSEAYVICLIFFIPLTIPLIQSLGVTILQARNQLKFRSIVCLLIAVFSLLISIPLTKQYSGIGCAIGTAFALIVGQIIVMNIYYKKKVSLDINKFWFEIIKMSIIPAMFCLIGLWANKYIDLNSYPKLFVGVVVFSVLYLPLFWFFSMNKYERELFIKPIKRLIKKEK